MKNQYIKNLRKIEFVVTNACTGHCKHCSEGDHANFGESIDADIASDAVRKIANNYDIQTVMAFGGEPLLFVDSVTSIMVAAREMNIPKRQIITNGYFSNNVKRISQVAELLAKSGVNEILLSVDAFHQETIPLNIVRIFASEIAKTNISLRLHPAWLVSPYDANPYNIKTREILNSFSDMAIEENEGNVIFPSGNALRYLSDYFTIDIENPYVEDPYDVKCVSFSPNGDVLGDNIYQKDINDILREYKP